MGARPPAGGSPFWDLLPELARPYRQPMLSTSTYGAGLERVIAQLSDELAGRPLSVSTPAVGRASAVWDLPGYGEHGGLLTVLVGSTVAECEFSLQPYAAPVELDAASVLSQLVGAA